MLNKRIVVSGLIALSTAGAFTLAGCGTAASGTANGAPPSGSAAPGTGSGTVTAPTATDSAGIPSQGPGYWGPGYWGPGMMGSGPGAWGPSMKGGGYWLAGDGTPVRSLDQAHQRADALAHQLGLRVGELMQFSWNYYAELKTPAGQPATEALVNPQSGAVGIEYGPAMMWNTTYGVHRGQRPTRVSATQAKTIAQRWLRDHGSALTAASTVDSYPGYYTMDTLQSGKISGMMSVNAATGAVWYHTWHGTYIATSHE